jgi:hypothetical protein
MYGTANPANFFVVNEKFETVVLHDYRVFVKFVRFDVGGNRELPRLGDVPVFPS